jgi:uncharacterized membrane protein
MLDKHFTNRGFLKGPYLPIYGSGAMAVVYVVQPLVSNPLLIFLFGLIVCSIIEYAGSLILEKAFKIKLWDYSNYKININGRVCGINSFLFGVLSLVVIYFINPLMVNTVSLLDDTLQYYLATAIEIVMTFDFATSVARMKAFTRAIEDIRIKSDELQSKIVAISANSPKSMLEAKDRLEEELNRQKALLALRSKKIFRAYPSMRLRNHDISVRAELFKMSMKTFIEKGREEQKRRAEKLNLSFENTKAQVRNKMK